jgi:hypothetical protein
MEEKLNQQETIKEALLPILQILIKEYSAIEPKSNNVMTRQNILKMIIDLCGVIYGKSAVTFGDILNAISYSWNNILDDNKDSIYESIGGVRNKNKIEAGLDNINKSHNYYKSNSTKDGYMKYDKEYVQDRALDKNEFIKILAENDIPYLDKVYNSDNLREVRDVAGEYLKRVFVMPQYKDLRFKDSQF